MVPAHNTKSGIDYKAATPDTVCIAPERKPFLGILSLQGAQLLETPWSDNLHGVFLCAKR